MLTNMVHTEQIIFMLINEVPDYYGGVYESLVPDPLGQTWATINQNSGTQAGFLLGTPLNGEFEVIVNIKDDFAPTTKHVINCRFGDLKVQSIRESARERTITMICNILEND